MQNIYEPAIEKETEPDFDQALSTERSVLNTRHRVIEDFEKLMQAFHLLYQNRSDLLNPEQQRTVMGVRTMEGVTVDTIVNLPWLIVEYTCESPQEHEAVTRWFLFKQYTPLRDPPIVGAHREWYKHWRMEHDSIHIVFCVRYYEGMMLPPENIMKEVAVEWE